MSVLERIRNRDPTLIDVEIPLNGAGLNDFVEALSESPLVKNVILAFNAGVSESVGECEALLSYLCCSTALRIVFFACFHFRHLPLASPQRQAVLQAFTQTMAAANANPNVDVMFDTSFLNANELLSDGAFYPSLKRVAFYGYTADEFSEPENQTIERAFSAMSSLEMLHINLQQQRVAVLLRTLHSHPRLQHLSVRGLGTNMEAAHVLSGVLSSTPLTRLAIEWQNGCFTVEGFEIIAQGLLHCPTLDQLELSCPGATETETIVLQAARFFHQCSTVSSIRHLSLDGNWKTSAVIRSILSVPVNGPSLPVTAHSIGALLQTLALPFVDVELLELLATNTSRLPHLSIKYVDETDWPRLCNILPALIYLQELTVKRFQATSLVVARTAMLQALRANGSLQTLTIGHMWQDPTQQLFTAIELRFVNAYLQRNRIAQALRQRRTDSLDHRVVVDDNSGIVSEPTCILYLLQAMQPAQRMIPTVLLAHAQRVDGNNSDRVEYHRNVTTWGNM